MLPVIAAMKGACVRCAMSTAEFGVFALVMAEEPIH
jgi:hypothetical protein